MRLVVRNFKQFREAAIEGDKILLYGPNGAGKSTLIHLIALLYGAAIGERIHDEAVVSTADFRKGAAVGSPEGSDGTYVKFEAEGFSAEIVGDQLVYRGREYPLTAGLNVLRASVWHVTEHFFNVYGDRTCRGERSKTDRNAPISGAAVGYGDRLAYGYRELKVSCPEAARVVSHYFNVYYDLVETEMGWIPLDRLSYGQRRLIVMNIALRLGDVVLIENLEAGLHVDTLADLITVVPHLRSSVVMETHSGLAVRLALSRGIAAYYVDGGEVKKIESLDLPLFQKELYAYSAQL
ncbi:MAG: AAA family ATPase [Thermoproteus sp.]